MNNVQNIIRWEDFIESVKLYKKYLAEHEISFEELQKLKVKEIKKLSLTEEEQKKMINSVKGVYEKTEKNYIRNLFTDYVINKITTQQVILENSFDFVNERLDILKEECGIDFTKEDRLSIGLDTLNIVYQSMVAHTTSAFDEKEIELFKKQAEENQKINRAFGRSTPEIDKIEGNKDD